MFGGGKRFFPYGGTESCPAAPYYDINVKDTSLLEALDSKLFKSLRDDYIILNNPDDGCVLFEHKDEVEKLLDD